jgi:hypothetical protein
VSLVAVFLAVGIVPSALGANRLDMSSFDALLDGNRSLAIDLTGHPGLLQSASFLAAHQALSAYFKSHPEVQAQLVANPNILIARERRFIAAGTIETDAAGNRVKRISIDWFDGYLEVHPELERALRQSPSLIDDPETLARNPSVAQLLKQDPAFSRSFKLHPGAYLNRAGTAFLSPGSSTP